MIVEDLENVENFLLEEVDNLEIFKRMAYKMASIRLDTVDDYIRMAKQAIADYESGYD